MDFKTIIGLMSAGAMIFAVLMALYWGLSIASAPSPQAGAEKLGEAVTYYAIPWWIKAIQFVVNIPVIGGLLVVGIVFYVAWTKR